MKLSIVIPVYNTEPYLLRCLSSCLDQDIPEEEYEVVVVNDGSTDGSLSVAEKVAASHPNVRIISQENGGLSRARNAGLAAAEGEYVWFVDSDDYIEGNCLGGLLERCSRDGLDVLGMGRYRRLPDGAVVERPLYGQKESRTVWNGASAMRSGFFKTPCAPYYVIRRAFLQENGLSFLEGFLHEDEEFAPRMFYLARRISFLEGCYYYACVREGSIMQTPNPKRVYDLLAIAGRLDRFSRGIDPADRYLFSRRIAGVLDSVFKLCREMPDTVTGEVDKEISDIPMLTGHLLRSRVFKYQFVGVLFKLFPGHSSRIYHSLLRLIGSVPEG